MAIDRLAASAVIVLATAGVAAAQGAPAYNWSGFYVGVGAGYGWNNAKWTETDTIGMLGEKGSKLNGSGFSLSGYAGYNFLVSPMVLIGGEVDLGTLSGGASKRSPSQMQYKADGNWIGSISGRAGLAFDRVLVFGRAGLAFSDQEQSIRDAGFGLPWSWRRKSDSGVVVGAGAEYAVTGNVVLRLDGSWYDFGSGKAANTTAKSLGSYGGSQAYSHKASNDNFTARAGIAYKF